MASALILKCHQSCHWRLTPSWIWPWQRRFLLNNPNIAIITIWDFFFIFTISWWYCQQRQLYIHLYRCIDWLLFFPVPSLTLTWRSWSWIHLQFSWSPEAIRESGCFFDILLRPNLSESGPRVPLTTAIHTSYHWVSGQIGTFFWWFKFSDSFSRFFNHRM